MLCGLASAVLAPAAWGASDPPVAVTGDSPFPPACNAASQPGIEARGSEVEPWIDNKPANAANPIGG